MYNIICSFCSCTAVSLNDVSNRLNLFIYQPLPATRPRIILTTVTLKKKYIFVLRIFDQVTCPLQKKYTTPLNKFSIQNPLKIANISAKLDKEPNKYVTESLHVIRKPPSILHGLLFRIHLAYIPTDLFPIFITPNSGLNVNFYSYQIGIKIMVQ